MQLCSLARRRVCGSIDPAAPQYLHYVEKHEGANREVFLVVDEKHKLGALINNQRSIKEMIRHFVGQNIKATNGPLLDPMDIGLLRRQMVPRSLPLQAGP